LPPIFFNCFHFSTDSGFCKELAENAAENKKFFAPAIFQKCWRGVGEQPTFAEQIETAQ
jgi:hypothetical protein